MQLIPVDSRMIEAVGYDAAMQELEVVFTSGKVFRYIGVPRDAYDALLQSDSKGGFMNDRIIGHYPDYEVRYRH